jgi:hypothetical protein
MKFLRITYTLLFLFGFVSLLIAQPGNPGSGPIGGVVYLLLAGLGLGYISLRKKLK